MSKFAIVLALLSTLLGGLPQQAPEAPTEWETILELPPIEQAEAIIAAYEAGRFPASVSDGIYPALDEAVEAGVELEEIQALMKRLEAWYCAQESERARAYKEVPTMSVWFEPAMSGRKARYGLEPTVCGETVER